MSTIHANSTACHSGSVVRAVVIATVAAAAEAATPARATAHTTAPDGARATIGLPPSAAWAVAVTVPTLSGVATSVGDRRGRVKRRPVA